METAEVNRNIGYDPLSTTGDPWFDTRMLVAKTLKNWNYTINTDHYLAGVAPASLWVDVYGGTDYRGSPDHHVIASLNSVEVASRYFDSTDTEVIQAQLPEGLLTEGANTLKITLPGDSGQAYDVVYMNQYQVTYPRSFWALDGMLKFEGDHEVYKVDNLPQEGLSVYRLLNGNLTRLSGTQILTQRETNSVLVKGSDQNAVYYVVGDSALLKPQIRAARPEADITTGSAEYLVITHPDFVSGLAPLVAARTAQGLTVRVVDIFDIYDQFNYGVVDPQAIKDYIKHAAEQMNAQYVLLVGDDTYDYKGYGTSGAISFIPSIYMAAGDLVQYAPVDPKYVDLDDNNVPDLPIGRFAVRTVAELANMVSKTLAYAGKDYGNTGVFASDWSFSDESDALIRSMPAGWENARAYLDFVGVENARESLMTQINSGVALTSYVGHSDDWQWTWDSLFNIYNADDLTNFGKPTIFTQNGCWNIYYVNSKYETLGDVLLNQGGFGAAAMFGSTTLTSDLNEQLLGEFFIPLLTQTDMPIGLALLHAKQALAVNNPNALDVLLGFSLLGDPYLMVTP